MKRFEPSRTYSSPSRRAVVRIAAESEPEPDSVSAYAGSHSPEANLGQVALLLLVAAGELEAERAELLHREDQGRGRADLPHLLDRDQREERAGAEPAVLLGEEEAEDVVLAEQLDDVPGELVGGVDLGRARRDPLARELPDEVAQLPLLVVQDVPGHGAEFTGRARSRASARALQPRRARRRSRRPPPRARAALVHRHHGACGLECPLGLGGGCGRVALGEQQPRPHERRARRSASCDTRLPSIDARSRSSAVRASARAPASSHEPTTASTAASQLGSP